MPKISLWNPVKDADYRFIDRTYGEHYSHGGDGILVHKLIGAPTGTELPGSDIVLNDFLFLEMKDRKYEKNVYELRGTHNPTDVDYDLSQFGIFLSSDTIRIDFHYNDMLDSIGRKLMAGDVLEFPSLRDSPIGDDTKAVNRYYVVQDSLYSAAGYGPKWYPHVWKVKAKQMQDSPEYKDIIESGESGDTAGGVGGSVGVMPPGWANMIGTDGDVGPDCVPGVSNSLSAYCKIIGITDEIIAEAESNAYWDPKFFENQHLYIWIDDAGHARVGAPWMGGDGIPPNGSPLKGIGTTFPEDMVDGEYYLRIDYTPDRLFQKQNTCFKRIEDDLLKTWTAYNKVMDTFVDNVNITTLDDGTKIPEKQALSSVMKQKVDLYADIKAKKKDQEERRIARGKKIDNGDLG